MSRTPCCRAQQAKLAPSPESRRPTSRLLIASAHPREPATRTDNASDRELIREPSRPGDRGPGPDHDHAAIRAMSEDEQAIRTMPRRSRSRSRRPCPCARESAHAPSGSDAMDEATRSALLMAIARSRAWVDAIITDPTTDIGTIAKRENLAERHVRFLAPLAYLVPAHHRGDRRGPGACRSDRHPARPQSADGLGGPGKAARLRLTRHARHRPTIHQSVTRRRCLDAIANRQDRNANRSQPAPTWQIPEIGKSRLETGRANSPRQTHFRRSPISAPAKAHGMRASAPVMAKSPNSGNAWLTTQFRRTGLGGAFPGNRENTGNFARKWPPMLNLMMISRRNINDLACKFPTQTNRELIPPNREQNPPDQGTAQDHWEFGGKLFREMLPASRHRS